ncbi:MAG: type II-A CRISPR-associated protein Csn2 [Bacilli bacterium]|nr:type II-A CRISPR-associated protein Csn2 [Bacilli bacterium]
MKLNIKYIDNNILIDNENIYSIEIENKKSFYRLANDFVSISLGNSVDDINLYDDNFEEVNILGKVSIIIDYFNINFDVKKYNAEINKIVLKNIDEKMQQEFLTNYRKLYNSLKKVLNDIDLPLLITNEFDLDNLLKLFKISINKNDNLLDNLLLLIDLEKLLNINKFIIFVNIKQLLDKNELEELYKYALYNSVNLLLIDSQCYGVCLKNEKKLIIDENLDEFMI